MLPMIFGNRARCTARQQVSFLATHVGEGEVPISAAEKGDQHVGEGEGEGVGGEGGGGEGGGGGGRTSWISWGPRALSAQRIDSIGSLSLALPLPLSLSLSG